MRYALVVLLLGLLLAGTTGAAGPAAAPSADAADETVRQILVLLQRPPEHLRAGSHYAGAYGDAAARSARRRVAARLAREHGLELSDDWPVAALGVDCYVMRLPRERQAERAALVQALGRDPRVAWAQPMHLYLAQGHDDPLFAVQPAAAEWHLATLHQHATGRGVRVAVVDSGVEGGHPDLDGQLEASENFVAGRVATAERHGTEVAGIIAARAGNAAGIVGVAPGARLLALRACWQDAAATARCDSLSLARALDHAIAQRVEVINLSLSGPPDRLLAGLLDVARRHGIGIVAAVDPGSPDGGFPASHPGVIAIADEGAAAAPPGALFAPGRDVPTTGPASRWYLVGGSSYAAAHVSGLLALLRETAGADTGPTPGSRIVRSPMGIIDACATVLRGGEACGCACAPVRAAVPPAVR